MEPAIWENAGAERRLSELGIPLKHLMQALRAGDAESRSWTPGAPLVMPGMARWGRTNEYLRIGETWPGATYENPGMMPMTISPNESLRIVATSGDEHTGIRAKGNKHPTTRYAKGTATRRAVQCNGQMSLDDLNDVDEEVGEIIGQAMTSESLPTWFLLYRVTSTGIDAELSLPGKVSDKGFIESLIERIILPKIEFEPDMIEHGRGDGDDGFDVVVVPRG